MLEVENQLLTVLEQCVTVQQLEICLYDVQNVYNILNILVNQLSFSVGIDVIIVLEKQRKNFIGLPGVVQLEYILQ